MSPMCFGSEANTEAHDGAAQEIPIRPYSQDSAETEAENMPVQWGWRGALANTPRGRSKAIQKSLTKEQRRNAHPTMNVKGGYGVGAFVGGGGGGYGC